MSYFPFFVDIEGKKGLIAGGGKVAAHKVEKLLPFGAVLKVIAPTILPVLKENPLLHCEEREFAESDINDISFVIAASDDIALNRKIKHLCGERGILVNVVDHDPDDETENCEFIFPAIVQEGRLVVGVSTGGASPVAAAHLRSRIASDLPTGIDAVLDYLALLRPLAKERITDPVRRAEFLRETARICMEKNRALTDEETGQQFAAFCAEASSEPVGGRVTLVGAGCGAYDLITVRGLSAVRHAQVLVYDDLIDPRLLSHASESCEKIYVGKRLGAHSRMQEEINAILIEKARQGKNVVRLKGGDPFVFGRGGEELLALKEAGIEASEIPGITSAIAVPAAAGIPVTHRGVSRSFHVITAHTADRADGMSEEIDAAAGMEGTCVFLMGFAKVGEIAKRLIEHGKAPETPVAVVHGGFDGSTVKVCGTLADIAQRVQHAENLRDPAVIVVGEAAGLDCGNT